MLQIIIKEVKEFLRDKTSVFFYLMFPIVMVFLCGNLLEAIEKAEDPVGQINIQYIVQTDDPYQISAIVNFIKAVGDGKNIIFEKSQDLSSSKELAGSDEIAAAVVFKGNPLEINIYEGTDRIKNRSVGAIMNGFVEAGKSISAIIKTAPGAVIGNTEPQEQLVKQKDLGLNRTMLDYYAVTMSVMLAFMSVITGSFAYMGERQKKTINRLIIAPKNKITVFFSKILGMVPQTLLQLSIVMLVSVFVFKAHYSANLSDNLYLFLMFFIVSLTAVSVGAVIGMFINSNPMIVVGPFIWVMMFFSGTCSKEINIKGITDKMPMYQVQEAAFDLTVFGRYGRINTVLICSVIVLILMLAAGAFIFSRKEEER